MHAVYTCTRCQRQYTVTNPGDYVCDCGETFRYPTLSSAISDNHTQVSHEYIDSSSRSFKREHYDFIRGRTIRHLNEKECILAKVSLICSVFGLLFFGLLSIPALLAGCAALLVFANPKNRTGGIGMAASGIILALISIAVWGFIFYKFLSV